MREEGANESSPHRLDHRPCLIESAAGGLGPCPYDQQFGVVARALGQPAEDGASGRGVPEQQRRPEFQHCDQGRLFGPDRHVAQLGARLLQLGQATRPVPAVEGSSAVDGLQSDPDLRVGRSESPDQAGGRQALSTVDVGPLQRRVGQHRAGGPGPDRTLPAVGSRAGKGLVALARMVVRRLCSRE